MKREGMVNFWLRIKKMSQDGIFMRNFNLYLFGWCLYYMVEYRVTHMYIYIYIYGFVIASWGHKMPACQSC